MSYPLTEEQQLIGQSAAEFSKEYLDPIAVELDHSGAFPKAAIEALAQHDFLGLFLSSDFGGAEAGFVSYVTVVESLARSCAAVASIVNSHAVASYAIQKWGSTEQKQQYLHNIARGELLGAIAVTENGSAMGVGAHALMAVRQENGYVLNGAKSLVCNGGAAGLYVVFATIAEPKGTLAFLLEAKAEGLTISAQHNTLGLRGCPFADLVFENVIVPDAAILASAKEGAAILAATMAVASVADAAQTVGIAQAAVEHAAAHAKQRIQFGRPIASFQAIQAHLADVASNTYATRLMVADAAAAIERDEPFLVEAAMTKLLALNLGQKSLIDTIQVEGGYGYSEGLTLARLYRDVAGTTLRDSPGDFPECTIAAEIV